MLELEPNELDESTREFILSEGKVESLGKYTKARQKSLIFHFFIDSKIIDKHTWVDILGSEVNREVNYLEERGIRFNDIAEEHFKNNYDFFSRNIGDLARRKIVEMLITMGFQLDNNVNDPQLQTELYIKLDQFSLLNNHFPRHLGNIHRDSILKPMLSDFLHAGLAIRKSISSRQK